MAKDARKLAARSYKSFRSVVDKAAKISPDHAVFILWEDHASIGGNWQSLKEVKKSAKECFINRSIGFPVNVTEKYVVLAQNVDGAGNVSDMVKILMSDVVALVRLSGKKE